MRKISENTFKNARHTAYSGKSLTFSTENLRFVLYRNEARARQPKEDATRRMDKTEFSS